jgi:signal transduction histidine kinase
MMHQHDDQVVLIHAPLGRDAQLAAQVLTRAGFVSRICADVDTLCHAIHAGAGCALVTEESLTHDAVRKLKACLSAQPPWSDFPFVLFSAGGPSGPQTGELARILGNVVIIDRPVHVQTLATAVWAQLRARARQYEARQAIQHRDQFLAMLGHELRNPLAAILFAAEAMPGDQEVNWQRQREVIERQARHLSRLVDDLLDVSRVTSGKVVLKKEPVDLNKVVERSAHVSDAQVTQLRQQLVIDLPAHPVVVQGDAVRLDQIVSNLVANAVKFTPPEGRIEVSLRHEGAEAILRVVDTGVGIEPELIDKVFELFAQAPSTIDRSQGGLGIGLTLVKTLVALHGGTVSVCSDGCGHGSCFEVRLPAAEQVREGRRPVGGRETGSRALRIVVVDDNADLRDMLQMLLEGSGHQVAVAEDGVHALAKITELEPDVAIIDIGLPEMDGYELARELRRKLGQKMRLVALSGYGQPDDRVRSQDAGFDLHLVKPVRAREILAAIAEQPAA